MSRYFIIVFVFDIAKILHTLGITRVSSRALYEVWELVYEMANHYAATLFSYMFAHGLGTIHVEQQEASHGMINLFVLIPHSLISQMQEECSVCLGIFVAQ